MWGALPCPLVWCRLHASKSVALPLVYPAAPVNRTRASQLAWLGRALWGREERPYLRHAVHAILVHNTKWPLYTIQTALVHNTKQPLYTIQTALVHSTNCACTQSNNACLLCTCCDQAGRVPIFTTTNIQQIAIGHLPRQYTYACTHYNNGPCTQYKVPRSNNTNWPCTRSKLNTKPLASLYLAR